jgi:hypothetical protein
VTVLAIGAPPADDDAVAYDPDEAGDSGEEGGAARDE